MHQLRVHMMALGLPLLNDALYPITHAANSDDFTAPLKLLARSLTFKHPINRNHHLFESRRSLYE
jgi:tRNA pseudouridine32 synthase/23S rRNA pseudouridine746 synthase